MTWKLAKDYAVRFNNSVSVMAGPAYDYNKDGLADQSFNESRCHAKYCYHNSVIILIKVINNNSLKSQCSCKSNNFPSLLYFKCFIPIWYALLKCVTFWIISHKLDFTLKISFTKAKIVIKRVEREVALTKIITLSIFWLIFHKSKYQYHSIIMSPLSKGRHIVFVDFFIYNFFLFFSYSYIKNGSSIVLPTHFFMSLVKCKSPSDKFPCGDDFDVMSFILPHVDTIPNCLVSVSF